MTSEYHVVLARISELFTVCLNGSDLERKKKERKGCVIEERGFQFKPSKSISDGSNPPSEYHIGYTHPVLKVTRCVGSVNDVVLPISFENFAL